MRTTAFRVPADEVVTKAYRDPASPGTVSLGSVVQESEYDGQGRRVVKAVKNSVALDATYHYYYTGWRLIETRSGSDNVLKQHVWGLAYIDELLVTSLNHDPADGTEDDCEFDYYALQDAHFNLLGMYGLDDTGRGVWDSYLLVFGGVSSSTATNIFRVYGGLIERYEYTPYGQRTVYFSPGTNDPDAHAPTPISRRWTVSSTSQPYGLNDIGHQGKMHDEATGLKENSARMYHPRLGRFMQRDPLRYVDGMNLYQYVKSNPLRYSDPDGRRPHEDQGASSCCNGEWYNPDSHCCEYGSVVAKVPIRILERLNDWFDHADTVLPDGTMYGFFTDDQIHVYDPNNKGRDTFYQTERPHYIYRKDAYWNRNRTTVRTIMVCPSQAERYENELERRRQDPDLDWTTDYNCASLIWDCGVDAGIFDGNGELPGNDWFGPGNLGDIIEDQYPDADVEDGILFGYDIHGNPITRQP